MLSNVTKKCDENLMLRNTRNEKTCSWQLMSLMLKFSREMLFFESGDTEVFKADRISCLQVITGKLTNVA